MSFIPAFELGLWNAWICIASASWLFLLFAFVYTVLSVVHAIPEERACLEKYGNAYRAYG